ncbi:T9SS type A sorting domain-containing protein [Flavobacterium sp.]|uniref:T9SS type A sorting domain-containing protein n=1 Tax=Flavobacterium sp. TaxID=239 RepID=UPI00262BECF9|nr:T9SS type A sorting domain-containing protein [Flavobacterium sp.]
MKKIYVFIAMLFAALTFGQVTSVAIVGEAAGGWPSEPGNPGPIDVHQMASTDGVNWTYENLVLTTANSPTGVEGGIKFRANNAWTINWGALEFPAGTGVNNGQNIQTVGGVYNVTFNSDTGAYTFVPTANFPSVGILGTALGGFDVADTDLATTDGINYYLTYTQFSAGQVKFRLDNAWDTNYGGTTFPNGTATINGANINVPAGLYKVYFNLQTGEYSFTLPSIGMIGTATGATNGFDGPDINLTTTDGINYTLYNYPFVDGLLKFRQDDSWSLNWGADTFPTGVGTQNGPNIPVSESNYTVNFNRITGAYSFETPIPALNVGIIGTAVSASGFDGDDVNMTTTDGITYVLENYTFTNGEAKFRLDDAWVTSYGGPNFPNGFAQNPGVNIPVTAGVYTVKFYSTNLQYEFIGTPTHPTVGILGTAVNANGFAGPDVNLVTTDGETYTLSNYTFTNGLAKFRLNDSWAVNWGSTLFPEGIGNQGGDDIPVIAGTYNVTFTRSTGAYQFAAVGEFPSIGLIGSALDGTLTSDTDLNLTTTNGIIYTLPETTFLEGTVKFRQNDVWTVNWGAAGFPNGVGVQDGADIPVPAGTYSVTFNRLTGAYDFAGAGFPLIELLGDGFINWTTPVEMTTSNGVDYSLKARNFVGGPVKFREGGNWNGNNWGSADFPTGTGVQDGPDIPVVANRYNVDFNRSTGAYDFKFVEIGIIGPAVAGWDGPDGFLATTDGINYQASGADLTAGQLKFRENANWAVNWGSADFPSGIGTQDGPEINIPETGSYTITFNRITGAYTFELENVTPQISVQIAGAGLLEQESSIMMTTTDNVSFSSKAIAFVGGPVRFVVNNGPGSGDFSSDTFPSGIAVLNGPNIPTTENVFNVNYNLSTKAYSFDFVEISLVGSAVSETSGDDLLFTSTDGINYTREAVVLVNGSLYFRQNQTDSTKWGSGTFPQGTANLAGSEFAVEEGTYNVSFNRITGAFNFEIPASVGEFNKANIKTYPNPSNNSWTIDAASTQIKSVSVFDITGKLVYEAQVNDVQAKVNANNLPIGMYFAKISTEIGSYTAKLVRN